MEAETQWLAVGGWRVFLTTDDDSNPKILCSSATPINKAYIHQLSFKNWLGFSLPWILPVPVDIITFNYYPPAIDAFPKVPLMGDFPATAMMTPEGTSFSSVICIILNSFCIIIPWKIPWKSHEKISIESFTRNICRTSILHVFASFSQGIPIIPRNHGSQPTRQTITSLGNTGKNRGFMMGLWAWKKHGQRILRFIKALKKTMANLLWPILSVEKTIVCFVRSIFFSWSNPEIVIWISLANLVYPFLWTKVMTNDFFWDHLVRKCYLVLMEW